LLVDEEFWEERDHKLPQSLQIDVVVLVLDAVVQRGRTRANHKQLHHQVQLPKRFHVHGWRAAAQDQLQHVAVPQQKVSHLQNYRELINRSMQSKKCENFEIFKNYF